MILDESINFRCPFQLKEDLQKMADLDGRKFSNYMNVILTKFVKENLKKDATKTEHREYRK